MFALISAISALLFSTATLPNGIKLIELPEHGDMVEIIAGYDETGPNSLVSSVAARPLIFNTYAVGGSMEVLNQLDRSALRFIIPRWALPLLADQQLAALFKEVPNQIAASGSTVPAARNDFRAKVEEEIRSALLGPQSESLEYATDDGFIAISASIYETLRDAMAAIPRRSAADKPDTLTNRLRAERTLRFTSELATGAVIFAAPVPSVYYKEWYLVLLLDQVIRGSIRAPLQTALLLSLRPSYYRLELSLAPGQFPEPAEESFLQDLQRLQFTLLDPSRLSDTKEKALAYLNSKEVREWFASRGILDRLEEGVQWIKAITADDLRAAARDLLLSNRVIATWSPKAAKTEVQVERLGDTGEPSLQGSALAHPFLPEETKTRFQLRPFPQHRDTLERSPVPERLAAGVSLVVSNTNAVFVSGGTLTKYNRAPDVEIMKSFQKYPADRVLVLAPAATLDRARELWSAFKGSEGREVGVPKGPVSSGDLPALFVLKTIIDLRVIQAGWWPAVELLIDANAGSALQIRADEQKRQRILEWIKDIAAHAPSDEDFAWMREVAVHQFENVRPDLQALTWERDPQGTIQDIQTVVPKFVQDVAQIYF